MPKAHPTELRAKVVATVATGSTIRETARQYGLDPTMVSRWVAAGTPTLAEESDVELIAKYLRTGLRALIVQAEVFGDPIWCRAQDAHGLATAHGILGDKLASIAHTATALGLIGSPHGALVADDSNSESDRDADPELVAARTSDPADD